MLAIYSCLKEWRSMLAGITFEVRTDYKNLIYFLEK